MASREASKAAIRTTLNQLKQFLSGQKTPRLSESDTKANFIEKYIDALGYQGITGVTREYYVKNSREFIDYVLRSGDKALLAIEAKALQHELTDKDAAQLVQYCAVEGIEWCVLTNGWELRLYNQYLKGALEAKLIFKLDLIAYNTDEEYEAIFEHLWLLSKESMTTPTGIKTWMEHQQLDKALRSLLLNPTSAPVKSLRHALADYSVHVSEEAVTQWFRTQLSSPVTPLLPQQFTAKATTTTIKPVEPPKARQQLRTAAQGAPSYWVVPAGNRDDLTAVEVLRLWLGENMWGMYKSTAGRRHMKPGDKVCFYASKIGVVAVAEINGTADEILPPAQVPRTGVTEPIYKVPLANVRWLSAPVALDESLRAQLDGFQGKSPTAPWAWYIQSTNKVSEHDFHLLTAETLQALG